MFSIQGTANFKNSVFRGWIYPLGTNEMLRTQSTGLALLLKSETQRVTCPAQSRLSSTKPGAKARTMMSANPASSALSC